MVEQFIAKVKATVAKYQLLAKGDKVLLAVSGGPDSVALLHWFFACQEELKLKLHIFHLNHLVRPEASAEAAFVANLGEQLNIPVTIKEFNVKKYCQEHKVSLQVGARVIRYQFLTEVASEVQAQKIALAHQANDQAETVLRNLLKGTGLKGLAGMPIKRDQIIRPLLQCSRREILAYLEALGANYIIDPSNLDPSYLRNYLRLKVVPLFLHKNPRFIEQLSILSQLLAEDEAYLNEAAQQFYAGELLKVNDEVHLKLHRLQTLAPAIGKRVLRLAIADVKGDLQKITFTHTNLLWESMVQTTKLKALNLPDKTVVLRENDCLVVYKLSAVVATKLKLEAGKSTYFNDYQITLELTTKDKMQFAPLTHWLDAEKISWPLFVRSVKPGDRFRPLGMLGSQKLQDFLVNVKVKKRERAKLPLIVTADDKIVAVADLRIAEDFKVTEKTKTVAKVVVKLKFKK